MKVRIVNRSGLPLPAYETPGSAGVDLRAAEELVLEPGGRAAVGTGIFVEMPPGVEGQVRPRSGLAARFGVTVLNAPGTVDTDYRGEIKVILANLGSEAFEVRRGMRIAQLVFSRFERVEFDPSESLSETERGAGGLGSTGH